MSACVKQAKVETTTNGGGGGGNNSNKKNIVEIYTDWANHYLDKTKGKHKIKNLQTELSDGLLLTEVIESVTHQKVPDIQRKPKTKDAMVTNIQACLNFLRAKGVAVEDIRADEIHDGNMKAILGLFFQLSRYKQQQKQIQPPGGLAAPTSPAKYAPTSPAKYAISSIPVAGSQHNSPKKSGSGSGVPSPAHHVSSRSAASRHSEVGGLRPPAPVSGKKLLQSQGVQSDQGNGSNGLANGAKHGPKQSMLQKFKSNLPSSPRQVGLGKRTSSSSGFSSARSDRSESSNSVSSKSSDTNFPSPAALRRIQENEHIKQMAENSSQNNATNNRNSIRSKLTKPETYRLQREKSSSPKRSPKLGHRPMEIKDYGPIDSDVGSGDNMKHYPPHAYSRSNSGISLKHTNISTSNSQHHVNNSEKVTQKVSSQNQNKSGIPTTGAGAPSTGVSGIPSPRGKPPAPPVRRSSDVTSCQIETDNSETDKVKVNGKEGSKIDEVKEGSEVSIVPVTSVTSTDVTSSYLTRTCSLPRHKRMGDSSPANVAVVSPMPHMTKSRSVSEAGPGVGQCRGGEHQEGPEDTLRGIAPMQPLGGGISRRNSNPRPGFSPYESHNIQTINTNGLNGGGRSGDMSGYMSDGDLVRSRIQGHPGQPGHGIYGGYTSDSNYAGYTSDNTYNDPGYISDNHYNRRAQRMAYEEQRARAEAEHRKYLEMSGKLGPNSPVGKLPSNNKPTYKLMGSRKNVKKSDSGIQTETHGGQPAQPQPQLNGQHDHWRAALEHNKAVLANQEIEMKEYLRRQQRVAEKHIKQFSPALARKHGVVDSALETMSMPGTPLGVRKNGDDGVRIHNYGYITRGGSLERNKSSVDSTNKINDAYSDSEYVQDQRLAKIQGSKSLPKKSSALNYGLLLGQIQQKRQQRKNKSVDGSVSDSNYTSYSDIQSLRRSGPQSVGGHYGQVGGPGWSSCQEDNLGSNESLDSVSSSIKQARAHSLNRHKPVGDDNDYYGIPYMLQKTKDPTPPKMTHQSAYSSLPSYATGNNTSSPNKAGRMFSSDHQEDVTSSHASLLSNGSSVYSTQEDKTNAEISKLRRELIEEHKKVINLTSQLATNAHVVSAFEQSLANMTSRLHQITKTAEKKDSEVAELRKTIDKLRQSGADAGLIKIKRTESDKAVSGALMRQASAGSVNSLTSALSNTSLNSSDEKDRSGKMANGKRSGWLRSSFSKAFAKHKTRNKSGSVSDCEDISRTDVLNNSDIKNDSANNTSANTTVDPSDDEEYEPEIVNELRKQLIEKDTLLTETRLEALSSVHQLESLKETVNKMKTELTCLKQDNEKLQTQVNTKSLGSSESSLNTTNDTIESDKRMSVNTSLSDSTSCGGQGGHPSSLDMSATTDPSNTDSKSISIMVNLPEGNVKIGTIAASCKLSWSLLDGLVERLFSEYIMLVDPVTNLGLSADNVKLYNIGEITRKLHAKEEPELLPYGYIIGDIRTIEVGLGDHVDSLAFDTLIPRSIIQRYVSLVREHKHVIISGPSTSGKSHVAGKLAQVIASSPRLCQRFTLTRENCQDLSGFLDTVTKCDVVIIDNLHHADNLDNLLQQLSSSGHQIPYIIGTMTQSSGATTDLQLRCNFRWILFANHIEPVRGYLGRSLRRSLLRLEVDSRTHNPEMYTVVEWVSKSFIMINKFLESHSSQDASLSPQYFLQCPMEVTASRLWFINLWNLNLVPHIMDSVREGLILYGRRSSWDDPVKFMLDSWPWSTPPSGLEDLTHIRPEDVGYDHQSQMFRSSRTSSRPQSGTVGGGEQVVQVDQEQTREDPLFNMLMTLQEAANTQPGDL